MTLVTQDFDQQTMKKNQLKQLIEELNEKGVTFSKLAVLSAGMDSYLGAVFDVPDVLGRVTVLSPKRFARYEMRHPQNQSMILVDFMIGDIDFINDGEISVTPNMMYYIGFQDTDCQISMAKLYLEYFDRKVTAKAAEAGLTLPKSGLIKG